MSKFKLLLVCENLPQAGSERWVYEICKSINKEKFEIGILCSKRYAFTESDVTYDNFYYHKIKNLNVRLYEYLGDYFVPTYFNRGIKKIQRTLNKFIAAKNNVDEKIVNLFENYDFICIIDFYNYKRVRNELSYWGRDNFCIVLHCHKIQFDFDPYECLDKDKGYKFTYFCPKQIEEIKTSGISEKSEFYFNPLLLDLNNHPRITNSIKNQQIIFAVFTRITPAKPIEDFIVAFEKIQKSTQKKCVLYIYGQVQDKEYYRKLLELILSLGIDKESIKFMGHTENIADSIKNDSVSVYWGLAINENIGYASIEIGAMGIPSFFWNFDEKANFKSILERTNNLMYVHNRVDDFVATNLKYISNEDSLSNLAIVQREYFFNRHNMAHRIINFEDYIISNTRK